jgi:EmrB/QacA subfamily drug resistance transporter
MARPQISQKVSVSVVYVLAMFMAIMDITIVNVALPTIGRDFGVPATQVDVVVTAFLVSLAIFIPASGWLGDRFGFKRVLLTAIAIFTVASALCGQAQSLTELVVFRVLQGVGGGMLTPVGMAMLYRTYPPSERVRAARILIIPTACAPALGPVIGGLLVTHLSWRWVFYVNVPIGAAAVLFGMVFLHEQREAAPGRFDVPGFLLAGIGFAALMYGISEGPSKGWGSSQIITTSLVGVILIAALIPLELRSAAPMLDVRLLKDRLFRGTTQVVFVTMSAFLGSLYLVALFFQDGLGKSPLVSGLSTFPEAIGVMLGAQSAGRLYPRVGPRRLMTGGLVSIAVLLVLMSLAGFGTTLWYLRVLMFVLGLSVAHVMVPSQASVFATVAPANTGRASGFFNAGRQLGSALGVAVLTTVLAAVGATHRVHGLVRPDLDGYHVAFRAAAGLALLGAAVAVLLIRDRDAASTMRVAGGKAHVAEEVAEVVPEDRALVAVEANGAISDGAHPDGAHADGADAVGAHANGAYADGAHGDELGAERVGRFEVTRFDRVTVNGDGSPTTDMAVRAEGKPAGS